MTKAERRVIDAAMALCRKGRGFCFTDDKTISDANLGKRLEYAVAALTAVRQRWNRQAKKGK